MMILLFLALKLDKRIIVQFMGEEDGEGVSKRTFCVKVLGGLVVVMDTCIWMARPRPPLMIMLY